MLNRVRAEHVVQPDASRLLTPFTPDHHLNRLKADIVVKMGMDYARDIRTVNVVLVWQFASLSVSIRHFALSSDANRVRLIR